MHSIRPTAAMAVAITTFAIIVAACGSGSGSLYGGGPAAPSGGGAVAGAVGAATISIASPADGAKVSVPFDVELSSSAPLGTPESGEHHAHLYFDSGTDAADYDIVYGTTAQVTRPLTPGRHQITVALANPDHSLAGPTQTISVTVVAAGGGAAQPAQPAPTAALPGY